MTGQPAHQGRFQVGPAEQDRTDARQAATDALTAQIRDVHAQSGATYGSPRVHGELRDLGVFVSRRRGAETRNRAGIVGLSGREHTTTTTRRDRLEAPFPDLVSRKFQAARPDAVWYGDVTYIWVGGRFWYLATVIDAATKELIGWAFADHMRAELVCDTLHAAIRRRSGQIPAGVIFHSDRGCQYRSTEFQTTCSMYKIAQSMGRRGVCSDNAGAESFISSIKRELVDRYQWRDADHLRFHLFNWIEKWNNAR